MGSRSSHQASQSWEETPSIDVEARETSTDVAEFWSLSQVIACEGSQESEQTSLENALSRMTYQIQV